MIKVNLLLDDLFEALNRLRFLVEVSQEDALHEDQVAVLVEVLFVCERGKVVRFEKESLDFLMGITHHLSCQLVIS